MNIEEFLKKRPYLYHLTDRRNLDTIMDGRVIFSAVNLVANSSLTEEEKGDLIKSRRPEHVNIDYNGKDVFIRDQRPINKALSKCLTDGWTSSDFIYHLNRRVFFWPTIERLQKHFKRYEAEKPVIIRVSSRELIEVNEPLFCRLNSGATRPNSYLGGIPPHRGPNTFVTANSFDHSVREVVEVTFEGSCSLPKPVEIGLNPEGPWSKR